MSKSNRGGYLGLKFQCKQGKGQKKVEICALPKQNWVQISMATPKNTSVYFQTSREITISKWWGQEEHSARRY